MNSNIFCALARGDPVGPIINSGIGKNGRLIIIYTYMYGERKKEKERERERAIIQGSRFKVQSHSFVTLACREHDT